jgi:hypothetical protein
MNANDKLLQYILETLPEYNCNFNKISLDKNPALHLALSLAGFSKYKEKCKRIVKMILEFQSVTDENNPLEINI